MEYQEKPGWSCEMKGVHHVNCSFIRVADPERAGVIRLVETGEANLRAIVERTRFGLVTQMKVASLPKEMKPVIGKGATSESLLGLPGWLGIARRDRTVEEPGRPGGVRKDRSNSTARGKT